VILPLALLACDGPTRADYERLERRVEVLEARERDRVAAARPAPVDPAAERMDRMQGELGLLGQPAPALVVARWLRGDGDRASGKAPYLLVFFPVSADSAPALARVATLADARDLAVLGVARGATVDGATAWLAEVDLPFPVALDADEATTAAYRRSASVSAVLVRDGRVVWTGTPAGLDEAVLRKHL
jgi:hypothetical protein